MLRYFIADLHLTDNEPVLTSAFIGFLKSLPDNCELYILGDFFDYWVGDDAQTELHKQMAVALKQLSLRNIKKYFMCGNRDFLVGKRYAKACDMKLLPDIVCIENPPQHNIVFLHGDLLCTDDVSYLKFRKKMHSKFLQTLFFCLPRRYRNRIADKIRRHSKSDNKVKSDDIMDVNQQAVVEMMQKYNATVMIHGHTHKPATHQFKLGNIEYKRIVLAAWCDGISYIMQDDEDGTIGLYNHSCK